MQIMTNQELKVLLLELVHEAIAQLYDSDYYIIERNVSERCVCARLSYHIECLMRQKYKKVFNGYNVDVEYDRKDGDPKHIDNSEKRHVCDLLIHRRGSNIPGDNLLALEMKVHNNYSKMKSDFRRLHDIVQHRGDNNKNLACETLLGIFLRIQVNQYRMTIFDVEINNGNPNKEQVVKILKY